MNSDSHKDSSQGVRVLSKRDWCSRGLKCELYQLSGKSYPYDLVEVFAGTKT